MFACLISVNTEVSKTFFLRLVEAGVFLLTKRRHKIAATCSFRSPDVDLNQMKSSLKCRRCIGCETRLAADVG